MRWHLFSFPFYAAVSSSVHNVFIVDGKHVRSGYTLHQLEKQEDKTPVELINLGFTSISLVPVFQITVFLYPTSSNNKYLLSIHHMELCLLWSTWAWWWHQGECIGVCCLGVVREIFPEDKIDNLDLEE